ncbi:MAG: glutathione S-transferase N-terminal domain-containing protein, partial [Kangiella sp.]|nr:glutathione S-transferase N-terminal domain-containing protein [Kangiella sp.]
MSGGLPILYSFRRCPYAMRARLALDVSGTQVALREVVLRDKPAEMLEVSPKATVPVLVLTDGTVIDESLDIMHWALARNDPEAWLVPHAAATEDMTGLCH